LFVEAAIARALGELESSGGPDDLVEGRYRRFRAMGAMVA
jgi:hypothetical protein